MHAPLALLGADISLLGPLRQSLYSYSQTENAGGLIAVAICWGFTNPFIKLGSRGVDLVTKKYASHSWHIRYVLPLAINLSGSAVYYYTLGNSSLSMIVPITNSLTFAFTILAGILLGEEMGSKGAVHSFAETVHSLRLDPITYLQILSMELLWFSLESC
ncbi:hypothetical protein BJ741DRAFT_540223 [Chytriomyces cf. hyalinus JEL632]|nr:hypothetical protein BJ741DRAFT_540223 [Chytriomyces cf. hyalinus JEL632]